MAYLFTFFIIFCFSIGVVTWVLAVALFLQKHGPAERFFLLFLTALMIRVIVDTLHYYIAPLIPGPSVFYSLLLLLGRMSSVLGAGALALFVDSITGRLGPRLFRSIPGFATAVILIFSIIHTSVYYINPIPSSADITGFMLLDFFYFLLLIYPLYHIFRHGRRIEDERLQRISRSIGASLLFFLIFMVMFDQGYPRGLTDVMENSLHLPSMVYIPYFLFYLFMNISLLGYGFSHLLGRRHQPTQGGSEKVVSTEFIVTHQITPREQDILILLGKGYSNRTIAEELSISPATVRNHLHNIFDKTGATTRLELIRMSEETVT